MHRLLRPTAAVAALLAGVPAAHAVTVIGTYSQNFDTLASTGTSSAVPDGWSFAETGTSSANDGLYAAGNGGSNAGNTYSFGSTGSTDRAFGMLQSGTFASTLFANFSNGAARAITALNVQYVGEQWRIGGTNRFDRISFAYSLNNGATFTDVGGLDFVAPNQSTTGNVTLDGNVAANRTLVNGTIGGLNLATGNSIIFRFSDFDAAGADDGLGIDDFVLTPTLAATAVPESATWAMMIAGFALMGVALRRRRAGTALVA